MRSRYIYSILLIVLLATPALANEKKIVLASLYRPPYTGEKLLAQGATTAVLTAALKAVGYELEVIFYPWNRTVALARSDENIDGFFPEYTGRENEFFYSDSIGKSPIGFAMRVENDFRWYSLEDLEKYKIGVVAGNIYSKFFDKRVKAGKIKTDVAIADVLNVRKVLLERIDMAVTDNNVFDYLMLSDDFLVDHYDELIMSPHLLAINDLFVCFRKDLNGSRVKKIINEGLSRIKVQDVQREYLKHINRQ